METAVAAEPNLAARPLGAEAGTLAAIVAWAQDCPPWQQDALRRLCEQDSFDAADLNALTSICKRAAAATPIAFAQVRDPAAGQGTVRLRALYSAAHFNAIVPNARMPFCRAGVTAIYGDNGSGKSGYARVLKKACRAQHRQGNHSYQHL